jgi:hypothetical protein
MDDCSSRRTSWRASLTWWTSFRTPTGSSISPQSTTTAPPTAKTPISVEIGHPWPPHEANILEPATWQLELLVAGDNVTPERSFVILSFDGHWPELDHGTIWEHFVVDAPNAEASRPP